MASSIQVIVQDILAETDIKSAPIPIEKIARILGYHVKFEPSDKSFCGVVFNDGDNPTIGVNSKLPRSRQRWMIAFGVGWFKLSPEWAGVKMIRDFTASNPI